MIKNSIRKLLKAAVVIICVAGFLLQTFQFLFLYWTYPTVVDIQVSIPSEIELPAISICSGNGIRPAVVCDLGPFCTRKTMFKFINVCDIIPQFCVNGKPPEGFRAVTFYKFFLDTDLNSTLQDMLRLPLREYFKCKIVSGASERECDIDNAIIGSYYSDGNSPSFCFTMNTLWSRPNVEIQKIKKSETIEMEFFIDSVYSGGNPPLDEVQSVRFNSLSSPTVQMAIHSPYIAASPYISGMGFLGGKDYKVKIKADEKHLLPPPYQTNCTDYMPEWKARGGVGPLNQIMVIQECKRNATAKELGCVPFHIDYPHNETICRYCDNCPNITRIGDNCTSLLRYYNQPCDFLSYHMEVEEKLVSIERRLYNCTFERVLTRRCQIIHVEIVFDEFEITNMTYNPKFESLELFSVIGGYMGMYLGVSIVAVYDFAELFSLSNTDFRDFPPEPCRLTILAIPKLAKLV
ncbi:uncharacterized protein TNIN_346221 [Trichonephila inaurata madagascariensis]|uniref:Uncharacterized protein n=1 Tax=Trichonephila inaurata madagascariensis TaxID=2747483 RepID=A0A8X7C6B2_9ARAC|nr:uncharacterized protein TNIN_346221 [Trichonephila inaurata madagascariensis]